jgi:hypothetical protein
MCLQNVNKGLGVEEATPLPTAAKYEMKETNEETEVNKEAPPPLIGNFTK